MSNTEEFHNDPQTNTQYQMDSRSSPLMELKSSMNNYNQILIEDKIQEPDIMLTLEINNDLHVFEQSLAIKYNNFMNIIQKNYFPELIDENQLLLAQGWCPIISQSINFTIEEAVSGLSHRFKVWKCNEFLLNLVNHLQDTQERNKTQSKQIIQLQDQNMKNTLQAQKEKYTTLKTKYKEQTKEYNDLKHKYYKNLERLDQNMTCLNKFTLKLSNDIIKADEKYQKQSEQLQQMKKLIYNLESQIQILNEEKSELVNLVTQLEKQQLQIDQQIFKTTTSQINKQLELEIIQAEKQEQQYQDYCKQKKQSTIRIKEINDNSQKNKEQLNYIYQNDLDQKMKQSNRIKQEQVEYSSQSQINEQWQQQQSSEQIYKDIIQQKQQSTIRIKKTENNEQKAECNIPLISITSLDMNKLHQTQQSQYELQQQNQENSKLITQLFKCTYCNLCCSEFIQLACLHKYHQKCLQELGRNSCYNQQSHATCMCSQQISIKMFNKDTQLILLKLQAAQIFEKYQKSYSLWKCQKCECFYQTNANEQAYCPHCIE